MVDGGKPEWKDVMPDILKHEFVGLVVEVVWSKNPDAVGIVGHIIDETRNTITIKTRKGSKSLAKDTCTFLFTMPNGDKIKVEGHRLVGRPEDRVKKKQKAW